LGENIFDIRNEACAGAWLKRVWHAFKNNLLSPSQREHKIRPGPALNFSNLYSHAMHFLPFLLFKLHFFSLFFSIFLILSNFPYSPHNFFHQTLLPSSIFRFKRFTRKCFHRIGPVILYIIYPLNTHKRSISNPITYKREGKKQEKTNVQKT